MTSKISVILMVTITMVIISTVQGMPEGQAALREAETEEAGQNILARSERSSKKQRGSKRRNKGHKKGNKKNNRKGVKKARKNRKTKSQANNDQRKVETIFAKAGESKFSHCEYIDLMETGYRKGSNCAPAGKFLFKVRLHSMFFFLSCVSCFLIICIFCFSKYNFLICF